MDFRKKKNSTSSKNKSRIYISLSFEEIRTSQNYIIFDEKKVWKKIFFSLKEEGKPGEIVLSEKCQAKVVFFK